jgi:UDPglucose 6-dehydrogenase
MRLIILGSGYVGLVSGACFAELGNEVLCVDCDAAKVARLERGDIPIYEPHLSEMITRNVAAGRLAFAAALPAFGPEVDAVFIAVGTPPQANGQGADLGYVHAAATDIAAKAISGVVVVTKSTVPVGTGDAIERLIREARPGLPVAVASNPEFLREGSAIADFMHPDRIVVGSDSPVAQRVLSTLYAPLAEAGAPIVSTGRRGAEIIKYAANAFLATKIAFINEIADFCEVTGADIGEVAVGVGLDRRIGGAFLHAGPGYGGSCFPKDTAALLATAQDHGITLRLVESTIAVNDARKRAMGRRVTAALGGEVQGKIVSVLGLTFKPNTDDMRDSPSLALIASLQRAGAIVRAYDPQGMGHARAMLEHVAFTESAYECVSGADCIVVTTEWSEFKALEPTRLARLVRSRLIVDLRNAIDAPRYAEAGFTVHGIGRRTLIASRAARVAVVRGAVRNGPPARVKRSRLNGNGSTTPHGFWDSAPN